MLLAASKSHLCKMLEICTRFALEVSLSFNAGKSVYMVFDNANSVDDRITFNGATIVSSVVTRYLGYRICSNHGCGIDFLPGLNEYVGKVNLVACSFKYVPYDIKYKLTKLLGHSLYGCENMKIDMKGLI